MMTFEIYKTSFKQRCNPLRDWSDIKDVYKLSKSTCRMWTLMDGLNVRRCQTVLDGLNVTRCRTVLDGLNAKGLMRINEIRTNI